MKIVPDANVIISAFGVQGLCAEVFDYCLSEHEIVTSLFIIEEVIRSLKEDFRIPEKKTREHRQFLMDETKVVTPLNVSPSACRDRNDLMILGTAWANKADIIITGDKDLLELKEFKGISILTVRQFWERRKNL